MKLEHLRVANWRNIEEAELAPGPGLTVLGGDNGQGKTNLLEAVWALTGGKSFRMTRRWPLLASGTEAPWSWARSVRAAATPGRICRKEIRYGIHHFS